MFGTKTSVKLSCVDGNCSGSITLLTRKVVVIHKVLRKKKETFRKVELMVVGKRGFSIVNGKTVMLPLFIKPYFARMVTPKRRLAVIGEISMAKQKPVRTGFVLVHGVLQKKKAHPVKAKHVTKTKKK